MKIKIFICKDFIFFSHPILFTPGGGSFSIYPLNFYHTVDRVHKISYLQHNLCTPNHNHTKHNVLHLKFFFLWFTDTRSCSITCSIVFHGETSSYFVVRPGICVALHWTAVTEYYLYWGSIILSFQIVRFFILYFWPWTSRSVWFWSTVDCFLC